MCEICDAQRQCWNKNFSERPSMFGDAPSDAAQRAFELLKRENKTTLLELGGGQGRDTLFFAKNRLQVTMLDYSDSAVETVRAGAQVSSLHLTAIRHDVREALPFADDTFDAAYSHMLYCMALSNEQIENLAREVLRVLKPGGLNIFTVRHIGDPHYRAGTHRGEEMYEVGGFIVNFFDKAKVERASQGYEIIAIDEFEEGAMPRRLFHVALRKPAAN